jgi:hypothetical protein
MQRIIYAAGLEKRYQLVREHISSKSSRNTLGTGEEGDWSCGDCTPFGVYESVLDDLNWRLYGPRQTTGYSRVQLFS